LPVPRLLRLVLCEAAAIAAGRYRICLRLSRKSGGRPRIGFGCGGRRSPAMSAPRRACALQARSVTRADQAGNGSGVRSPGVYALSGSSIARSCSRISGVSW
jgi:hypothetical protein